MALHKALIFWGIIAYPPLYWGDTVKISPYIIDTYLDGYTFINEDSLIRTLTAILALTRTFVMLLIHNRPCQAE